MGPEDWLLCLIFRFRRKEWTTKEKKRISFSTVKRCFVVCGSDIKQERTLKWMLPTTSEFSHNHTQILKGSLMKLLSWNISRGWLAGCANEKVNDVKTPMKPEWKRRELIIIYSHAFSGMKKHNSIRKSGNLDCNTKSRPAKECEKRKTNTRLSIFSHFIRNRRKT